MEYRILRYTDLAATKRQTQNVEIDSNHRLLIFCFLDLQLDHGTIEYSPIHWFGRIVRKAISLAPFSIVVDVDLALQDPKKVGRTFREKTAIDSLVFWKIRRGIVLD